MKAFHYNLVFGIFPIFMVTWKAQNFRDVLLNTHWDACSIGLSWVACQVLVKGLCVRCAAADYWGEEFLTQLWSIYVSGDFKRVGSVSLGPVWGKSPCSAVSVIPQKQAPSPQLHWSAAGGLVLVSEWAAMLDMFPGGCGKSHWEVALCPPLHNLLLALQPLSPIIFNHPIVGT